MKYQRSTKKIFYRIAAASVFAAAGFLLLLMARRFPAFAAWYVLRIYPVLVNSIGRLSGCFPFSVTEIGLYLLLLLVILSGMRMLLHTLRLVRTRIRTQKEEALFVPSSSTQPTHPIHPLLPLLLPLCSWISGILLTAGILFFLYVTGCGINYQRSSFTKEEGLSVDTYSTQELGGTCTWLTAQVNLYAASVSRNTEGIMIVSEKSHQGAIEAMQLLGQTYASLDGYYPQPKELIFSEILSIQNVTGVYSPFFIEANYNGDMTGYNIPFTMCHELSHLRGFMNEKEANYIAFLACIGSDRADFNYSGYLSGWVYCMNALLKADASLWKDIRTELTEEALADLKANNTFWDAYEGTVSEIQDTVNDTYLKANGQSDGIKSYGRIVDLIVTYYLETQSDAG